MEESTQALLTELRRIHDGKSGAHARDHAIWVELLSAVQECWQIKNDAELAKKLGITRTMVHFVKTGKQPASTSIKIKVLEGLGQMQTASQILDNLQICLPEKISQTLRSLKVSQ